MAQSYTIGIYPKKIDETLVVIYSYWCGESFSVVSQIWFSSELSAFAYLYEMFSDFQGKMFFVTLFDHK